MGRLTSPPSKPPSVCLESGVSEHGCLSVLPVLEVPCAGMHPMFWRMLCSSPGVHQELCPLPQFLLLSSRGFFFLLCLFYFLGALFAEDVGRSVASCWHRLVLQHCSGGTGIQSPRSGMLQDPCCVPTHGCWGWRGAHSTAAYPSAHRRKCRGLF